MNASCPLIAIVYAEPTDRVPERRIIVAVVISVRALANDLVLRMVLLIRLDLADH